MLKEPAALPPAMEAVRQAVLVPPPAYTQTFGQAAAGPRAEALLRKGSAQASATMREARGHNSLLRSAANFMMTWFVAGSLEVTAAQADALVQSCEEALTNGEAAIARARATISDMEARLRGRAEQTKALKIAGVVEDAMILVQNALVYTWQRAVAVQAELDPQTREIVWSGEADSSVSIYLAQLDALDA